MKLNSTFSRTIFSRHHVRLLRSDHCTKELLADLCPSFFKMNAVQSHLTRSIAMYFNIYEYEFVVFELIECCYLYFNLIKFKI